MRSIFSARAMRAASMVEILLEMEPMTVAYMNTPVMMTRIVYLGE
jgi:hypothetical protein